MLVEQRLAQTVALRRFQTTLLAALAVVALAVIGAYGVIHRSVAERTQEVGVRMALGASAPAVLRMVLAGGLRLAIPGSSCPRPRARSTSPMPLAPIGSRCEPEGVSGDAAPPAHRRRRDRPSSG